MSIRDRLQSWGNTNTDEAMTLVMEKNISHEKVSYHEIKSRIHQKIGWISQSLERELNVFFRLKSECFFELLAQKYQ